MNRLLKGLIILNLLLSSSRVVAIDTTVLCDGIIEDSEYSKTFTFQDGKFELFWEIIEDRIHFGMMAQTLGYISLNIDPTFLLKNGDLYYGFVNESASYMVDQYSTGVVGPPENDVELGGTYDILEFEGKEDNGYTIFEFTRLLDTGDDYDNVIPRGEIDISWSYHSSDDISRIPSEKGSALINFQTGSGEETSLRNYFIIAGVVLVGMIVGIYLFIRYRRTRRNK